MLAGAGDFLTLEKIKLMSNGRLGWGARRNRTSP